MSRRYKTYAADTGIAYRYFFESRRSLVRPSGLGPGSDYVFVVTADQGPPFEVRVFVSERAMAACRAAHSRELDPSEQYALAKMRLFQAFDELEDLRGASLSLVVDESNVEQLLAVLDLV